MSEKIENIQENFEDYLINNYISFNTSNIEIEEIYEDE